MPTALYGAVLLMPAIAYYLLQKLIIHVHGAHFGAGPRVGRDTRAKYH